MGKGAGGIAAALAVLALVLAAALLWSAREHPEAAAPAGVRPAESAPAAVATAGGAVEPSARAEATGEPSVTAQAGVVGEEPSAALVRGLVLVKGEDEPVAGAVVHAIMGSPSREARTDEDGAFTLELLAGGILSGVRIAPTERTAASTEWLHEPLVAGATLERTFYVTRGGTLSGVVRDQEGEPVPGATVSAWCTPNEPVDEPPDRTVVADAGGAFTIEHLGESFFLAARTAGLCCARGLRGKLAGDSKADGLEVVLAPCATITARVVDEDGTALPGARVEMRSAYSTSSDDTTTTPGVVRCWWGAANVTADAEGRFRIEDVADPRRSRSVWLEHEECIGDHRRLDPEVPDQIVVLERGIEVRGTVLGPDGEPVERAVVSVDHMRGRMRTVRTDADGAFVARGVKPAQVGLLRARADGFAVWAGNTRFERGMPPVVIHLEHPLRIAGQVVDGEGAPLSFAKVALLGEREVRYADVSYGRRTTWEWAHGIDETTADADGRFAFDQLYDGTYEVGASPPGEPNRVARVRASAGDEGVIVAIDDEGLVVLVGRVVDEGTGAPIEELQLTLMRESSDGSWWGRNEVLKAPDGSFRHVAGPPGKIQVNLGAEGHAKLVLEASEYAPGEHRVDAALAPERTLALRFVREDGTPYGEGVSLRVLDEEGDALWVRIGLGTNQTRVWANEACVLAGLPARRVTLEVENGGEHGAYAIDLSAPAEGEREIVVPRPGPR